MGIWSHYECEGQLSLFEKQKFKIKKPIRLIELFAGVGSQAMALRDIGADFEHYRVVEFDKYAILVLNKSGRKLGYVPRRDNRIIARLMDAGKLLKAQITSIKERGTFKQIAIGIYLVDF